MKINRIQNHYIENAYKSKDDKRNNIDINKEKSVSIEISNSAKELVDKIERSDDKSFSDKVEKIRKSILDGSYKVSSEEIADKILQTINEQKGSDK